VIEGPGGPRPFSFSEKGERDTHDLTPAQGQNVLVRVRPFQKLHPGAASDGGEQRSGRGG
jgi:hypothetical protein